MFPLKKKRNRKKTYLEDRTELVRYHSLDRALIKKYISQIIHVLPVLQHLITSFAHELCIAYCVKPHGPPCILKQSFFFW